ncbi:MAG TPA: MFS transporter [Syntrophomonadaceae bacterium]|nr:MFS transporter [Syntrophomonadaceae bacterium]
MTLNEEVKSSGKWIALILCVLSSVVINIPYLGYSTALPQIMLDLNINYTQASILSSATALTAGIGVLFGGILADKWGPARSVTFALLWLAIGQIIFAFMPSYSLILATRMFIGLGVTLIFAGTMAVVVRWFEGTNHMGVGVGGLLSSDGLGGMFSLYGYAFILSYFGWRTGSAIGAAVVFAMFLICYFYLREHPSYYQEEKEKKLHPVNNTEQTGFKRWVSIVMQKNVLIPACFIIGYIGANAVIVYWIPTILQEQGWSSELAGFISALYPFVGIAGALASGSISDRVGKKKPLVLISGLGMAASFIVSAIAIGAGQYTLLAAMLPIAGFCAYIGSPLVYIWAANAVGVKNVATANGFILAAGFLIGGTLYPFVCGYLKDILGTYSSGFMAAAISLVILNVIIPLFADDTNEFVTDDENKAIAN